MKFHLLINGNVLICQISLFPNATEYTRCNYDCGNTERASHVCLRKLLLAICSDDRQTDFLFRRKLLQFLVYQHAHMTISYGHNIYMADNK